MSMIVATEATIVATEATIEATIGATPQATPTPTVTQATTRTSIPHQRSFRVGARYAWWCAFRDGAG
jgi:hypothetical protein